MNVRSQCDDILGERWDDEEDKGTDEIVVWSSSAKRENFNHIE